MKRCYLLIAALAAWTVTAALAATSGGVHCPAALTVEQRAKQVEEGWEADIEPVPHRLARITFFAGPPAERASLAPTEKPAGKQRTLATWNLAAGDTYWLSCGYARTNVVLSRRLPPDLRSCSVIYAMDVRVDGTPEIVKFECR